MTGRASLRQPVEIATGKRVFVGLLALAVVSLLMAFGAEDSSAAGLKLKLSPNKNVPAGKRVCFTGVVRGENGNPVRGAKVNLDGRLARSKRGGKVRICKELIWPGRHAAQVQKGRKTGTAVIRAKSYGVGLQGGTWIRQEMQLPAYPHDEQPGNNCHYEDFHTVPGDFAEETSFCYGWANSGTSGIFSGRYTTVKWKATVPGNEVQMVLQADYPKTSYTLTGGMIKEQDRMFYVISGKIDESDDRIYTGTDRSQVGEKGGPFAINITKHHNGLGMSDGYTFHTIGWIFKEPK